MRLAGRGGRPQNDAEAGASEGPINGIFFSPAPLKNRGRATLADLIKMSEGNALVVGASETVRNRHVKKVAGGFSLFPTYRI